MSHHHGGTSAPTLPDAARVAEVAGTLGRVEDADLKDALARLGASLASSKTK